MLAPSPLSSWSPWRPWPYELLEITITHQWDREDSGGHPSMDGSRMQNDPDRRQYEDVLHWWVLQGGADDSSNDDLGLYSVHALLDHYRSFDRPRYVPHAPP